VASASCPAIRFRHTPTAPHRADRRGAQAARRPAGSGQDRCQIGTCL